MKWLQFNGFASISQDFFGKPRAKDSLKLWEVAKVEVLIFQSGSAPLVRKRYWTSGERSRAQCPA
jgi:hypothetical protein